MSAASLLLEFEDALRRGDSTNLENVFVRAAELPQRVTGRTAAKARSAFDLDAGREALDGGWPPLLYAAKEGHAALVSLLLARGANIEARAFCDADALTLAAGIGSTETVEVLLRMVCQNGRRRRRRGKIEGRGCNYKLNVGMYVRSQTKKTRAAGSRAKGSQVAVLCCHLICRGYTQQE